jgi:NAD(P)-dependent dehydrogenase (short-subunit alcohol dehydrogenase family)
MKLELQNKVILLTGATGGIGKQVVLDFIKEDAIVVCLIRNQKKMEEMLAWLKEQGVSVVNVHSLFVIY